MSNEELIELDNELVEMNDDTQSENENEIIEVIPTDIPSKILEACDIATKFDPNHRRSQIFHNNLQQICKPYRELQIIRSCITYVSPKNIIHIIIGRILLLNP